MEKYTIGEGRLDTMHLVDKKVCRTAKMRGYLNNHCGFQ